MPHLSALDGGLALVMARGLSVGAELSVFGTLVFRVAVVPRSLHRASSETAAMIERLMARLTRYSLVAALITTLAWLVLQAGDMADAASLAADVAATPEVLAHTSFGHIAVGQLLGLAGTWLVLGPGQPAWRTLAAVSIAGVTTALQACHGHGFAMAPGPSWLLLSGIVHLLAAGAWLGGLLPLLLLVRHAPPRTAATAARWFSPLGKWCVAGLAGSALFQAWSLVGGLPGLVGTFYGWLATAKLALLAVLLAFAAVNRYRLAPALLATEPDVARTRLVRSVFVQTGFGLLTVLVASMLASLPPAVHEQPLWPFDVRPSLVALSDPDLAREVIRGALGAACGVVLLGAAFAWRRTRWALLGAAALAIGAAAPHLDLLLVEANPTSYFQSPTGFAATGIARGAVLFVQNCASCHGAGGAGDGPLAAASPVPPADLTAGHLWEHSDGELFWWLAHGMELPGGGVAMPGFADRLSDDDRWALIDYIRAHNAGVAMRADGAWPHAVPVPAFGLSCGTAALSTTDLTGRIVHVIAGPPPQFDRSATMTLLLTRDPVASPAAAACVATDASAWTAFAILAGVSDTDLAGTEFLVDGAGSLREEQLPGGTTWSDPAALASAARRLADSPIAVSQAGGHLHH